MNTQKIKELEDKARELADEIAKLKAEPEVIFKKDEFVEVIKTRTLHIIGEVINDTLYFKEGGHWSKDNCKKPEVLPINFTPWGGGNCPVEGPVTVMFYTKHIHSHIDATTLDWKRTYGSYAIIGYQRIEIL